MVLYILRHERRNLDQVGFFTPLTSIGKHNANIKVYSKFEDIELDAIYSSPYKRTLETVEKISRTKDIPVRIDWALSEKVGADKVNQLTWPDYSEQEKLHELFHVDKDYTPTADKDYITSYKESLDTYLTRVDTFCQYLETQKDKHILIVSHQSITDRIIQKLANVEYQLEMGECYEISLD